MRIQFVNESMQYDYTLKCVCDYTLLIWRSYLVPTNLVPTHFITTSCQLLMQFTLNLLKIDTSFL